MEPAQGAEHRSGARGDGAAGGDGGDGGGRGGGGGSAGAQQSPTAAAPRRLRDGGAEGGAERYRWWCRTPAHRARRGRGLEARWGRGIVEADRLAEA